MRRDGCERGRYLGAHRLRPALSTTTLPSDLSFRAHGLKNISAEAEYVVCNVFVDAESPTYWTNTDPAQVKVLFHAAATGTSRCELYIGSNLAGSPVSYVQDLSLLAGEPGHILFGDVSGSAGQWPSMIGDRPPVSLFCRMPPGASILKIETSETGATDA